MSEEMDIDHAIALSLDGQGEATGIDAQAGIQLELQTPGYASGEGVSSESMQLVGSPPLQHGMLAAAAAAVPLAPARSTASSGDRPLMY